MRSQQPPASFTKATGFRKVLFPSWLGGLTIEELVMTGVFTLAMTIVSVVTLGLNPIVTPFMWAIAGVTLARATRLIDTGNRTVSKWAGAWFRYYARPYPWRTRRVISGQTGWRPTRLRTGGLITLEGGEPHARSIGAGPGRKAIGQQGGTRC